MKKESILFGVFLFFLGLASFGQGTIPLEVSAIDSHFTAITNGERNKRTMPTGNQVYIQQVGVGNYAKAMVASQKSKVEYRQQGDFNYINFDVQAHNVEKVVHQKGDSNRAFGFFNGVPETAVGLQLFQNGNNQHFEQFGTNSIGEKMQLKMNGNTNSIIVRNFK